MIKFHLKASHNIRWSATKGNKQQETPKGQCRKNYTQRKTHALSRKTTKDTNSTNHYTENWSYMILIKTCE